MSSMSKDVNGFPSFSPSIKTFYGILVRVRSSLSSRSGRIVSEMRVEGEEALFFCPCIWTSKLKCHLAPRLVALLDHRL